MALTPSTIPTSFVPKQPVRATPRFDNSGSNVFLVLSLVVLGVALAATAGVFGYHTYLKGVYEKKSVDVANAQEDIDSATVEDFIHARDRFAAAKSVLDSKVAASRFFELLESITLQTVRFNSFSFRLAEDRSGEISMSGTARTFNALAAESAAFAAEKRIKRAIFSDIGVNENGTVSFSLNADLDPKLLQLVAEDLPPAPAATGAIEPVQTGTPATSTATTTTP